MQTQARDWCFTVFLNEETAEGCSLLDLVPTAENKIRYSIYQLELSESGRLHYQGYIQFSAPVRMSWVKNNVLDDTAHLEKRRGTPDEARAYCQKLDTRIDGPWETGEFVAGQGSRTDLAVVAKMVKENATAKAIFEAQPSAFIRYSSGILKSMLLFRKQRDWPMEVIICVGSTGTGKSKWCASTYPGAYWKQRSQWWDGFDGQETVIVDDFYGWLPFDEVLRLCDRYPLLVQNKGGQIEFNAKRIIFTSNVTPDKWWKKESIKAGLEPLHRRTTLWKYFHSEGHTDFDTWALFWFKINGDPIPDPGVLILPGHQWNSDDEM